MAFFDLPLEQLKTYKPERQEPQDFDQFWKDTLDEAAQFPLDAKFEPVNYHLKTVEAFDLTFNGFGGQPIKGWLMLPKQRSGKIPCVVEFIGYGGGRNHPFDWLLWSSAGYAHLVMDTRGQGTSWSTGSTPDVETEPGNPHYPGFMTKGILSPQTYYYRRLMTDGVRAVEAAKAHPAVDSAHVATVGTSQGGGLSLAVGGLSPEVEYVIADVPFLCHYRRATQITDAAPYLEISRYCQRHRDKIDTVFNTLSYFDGVNFATRIKGESMVSVGLMDEICPPSTVFAAYNYIPGKKQLNIWEYNHHEGGESYNILEKLKFLGERWG